MRCAYCGTEIEPRAVNQKYCSHRCACKASYHKRVRFESVTFECSMCGRTVVTDPERKDKRTRFCSHECEKKYWRHPPYEHETSRQNFRSVEEYGRYEQRTNEA